MDFTTFDHVDRQAFGQGCGFRCASCALHSRLLFASCTLPQQCAQQVITVILAVAFVTLP